MKIGFIRYPEYLYQTGKVNRGGSEIATQYIINYLRSKEENVVEFMPESMTRINLMDIPALGTPLMFQDLLKRIDQINDCDVIITTNWFGAILPEITKPIVTVFHANASLVLDSIEEKNIDDFDIAQKWLKKARTYQLAIPSPQTIHEKIITLGENYFTQQSKHIIAVSQVIKDSIIKYNHGDDNKISVIYNAYSKDWMNIKIEKDYNSELILSAITRLPHDYNGFIGKGAYRIFELFEKITDVKKQLSASTKTVVWNKFIEDNFSDIDFKENIDRISVGNQLAKSHFAFVGSRCEAFSLGVVEAMMMKNVVFTYPIGVVPEIIKNGENGFIVNSVDEVISTVNRLKTDKSEITRISENAQKTILELLNPDIVGDKYLKLLTNIIS